MDAMKRAVLLGLLVLLGALAYESSFDQLARLVSARVTCTGARCTARLDLPIKNQVGTDVRYDVGVAVEFEGYDMALHFTVSLNGENVLDVLIAGENPISSCYTITDNADPPPLMLCIYFNEINSIGNSLQTCAAVGGGIVNNPSNVLSMLGCFIADTQTSSMEHAIKARPRAKP